MVKNKRDSFLHLFGWQFYHINQTLKVLALHYEAQTTFWVK